MGAGGGGGGGGTGGALTRFRRAAAAESPAADTPSLSTLLSCVPGECVSDDVCLILDKAPTSTVILDNKAVNLSASEAGGTLDARSGGGRGGGTGGALTRFRRAAAAARPAADTPSLSDFSSCMPCQIVSKRCQHHAPINASDLQGALHVLSSTCRWYLVHMRHCSWQQTFRLSS